MDYSSIIIAIFSIILMQTRQLSCMCITESPCPKLFQYRIDNNHNRWFGIIQLINPNFGENLLLKVHLLPRDKLQSDYAGKIEMLTNEKVLSYKIQFPLHNCPPQLLKITLNKQNICRGHGNQAQSKTQIVLQHNNKHPFTIATQSSSSLLIKEPWPHTEKTNLLQGVKMTQNNCGINAADMASLNGYSSTTIRRGLWPWLVAIYVNNSTSLVYHCGGTIVSQRVVISAAHCFHLFDRHYTAEDVVVLLGRSNLTNWNEDGSMLAPVSGIYLHPAYKQHLNTFDADIAVLLLKTPVTYNTFIQPACLWSSPSNIQHDDYLYGVVAGWKMFNGLHDSNAVIPKISKTLIMTNDECIDESPMFSGILTQRTFCARVVDNNAASPCSGDSGIGLLSYIKNAWYLRGVASGSLPIVNSAEEGGGLNAKERTTTLCNRNQLIVYVDVMQFKEWILTFIDTDVEERPVLL